MRSKESTREERKMEQSAERRRAFAARLHAERYGPVEPRPRLIKEEPSGLDEHLKSRTQTAQEISAPPPGKQEKDIPSGRKLVLRNRIEASEEEVNLARAREQEQLLQEADAQRILRRKQMKEESLLKREAEKQAEVGLAERRESQRFARQTAALQLREYEQSVLAARRQEEESRKSEMRSEQRQQRQRPARDSEVPSTSAAEGRVLGRQEEASKAELEAARSREAQREQSELASRQAEAEFRATRLKQLRDEEERILQERQDAEAAREQAISREQTLIQEEEANQQASANLESDLPPLTEEAPSPKKKPIRASVARRTGSQKALTLSQSAGMTNDSQSLPASSYVSISGSFILDENGDALTLRGVTIRGLDTVSPVVNQTFPAALALDDANLSTMSDQWHINLVRFPFQAQTIVSGNGSLSSGQILTGLDQAVAAAIEAGMYVLLAMEAPQTGGSAPLPDATTIQALQALSARYGAEPRVLYEPFSSATPLAPNWLQEAPKLLDVIRQQSASALIFIGAGNGGTNVTGLPLRSSTGDSLPNIIYTIAISPQNLPSTDDGNLRGLSESYPVFASWTDDGSDFERSSTWVADLLSRYGIGWASSNWNSAPRLVNDAVNHDFTPTAWGVATQHALALPAIPLLKDSRSENAPPTSRAPLLSTLSTNGSYIVDANGTAIVLRGVTVRGLDTVNPSKDQTFAAAMSLDDNNLSVLTQVWHANVVRLPFQAASLLSGNGSLSAAQIVAGVDLLVTAANAAGAYVLLTLEAPSGSGGLANDPSTVQVWQMLAERHKSRPGVLYELFSCPSPLPSNWLQTATNLIRVIRQKNLSALIFVCGPAGGVDVTSLPILMPTGDPLPNLVYTIAASPHSIPTADNAALSTLTEQSPVFASAWSDDGSDFGRSSARVADLFSRYSMGWAASNWNLEPRLVKDAAAHDFSPSGWGLVVGRALSQPIRPLLTAFA